MTDDGDDELVSPRAAELFREGFKALAGGDLDAVALLEESADLEGGLGGSVTRAQAIRMLVQRKEIGEAVALLDRSAQKDPDVRWRTLGDVLEPLVVAGRSDDAVASLIATAESLRHAHDFTPAFTGFLNVFQSVRVPPPIDQLVLAALRRSSGDRLDARLAVERLSAGRAVQAGRGKEAVIRLAAVAADAIERSDREVERRASSAALAIAAVDSGESATHDCDDDVDRPLFELLLAEEAAQELGSGITKTADVLLEAARSAALEGELGAAAVLERLVAVLLERCDRHDEAVEAAARALEHAEATGEMLIGEVCFVTAWLAGADPEPNAEATKVAMGIAGEDTEPTIAGAETERAIDVEAAMDEASPGRLLVEAPDDDAWTVRVGGVARLPRDARWPQCQRCGDPLTFVAELGPEALDGPDATDGPGARRAFAFACNIAPWVDGYESSCHAASAPHRGGSLVIIGPATADTPRRLAPAGTPIVVERRLVAVDRKVLDPRYAEEVGGPPVAQAPRDEVTGAPMRLAARLGGAEQTSLHVVNGGFVSIFVPEREDAVRGATYWWTAEEPAPQPPVLREEDIPTETRLPRPSAT